MNVRSSLKPLALAIGLSLVLALPAHAGLPRTYDVQRVDDPTPSIDGKFGLALAGAGDVNGDGHQDLLSGTDKHGRELGQSYLISGLDGAIIRELELPDADTGEGERASGFGAAVGRISHTQASGAFFDIGSCPGGSTGNGAECDAAAIGAPDGVPEMLVTASGVDVNPATGAIDPAQNNDLGVAYVFDGATGALLKRLLMPQADRQMQVALDNDPRFGRAALSPGGLPPCPGFGGIAPTPEGNCPNVPPAVAFGDVDGGGAADILVAATDLDETPANSHPDSPCAAAAADETCAGAGRVYMWRGESIRGTDPAVADDTPNQVIRDRYSSPDGGSRIGTVLIPVGDLGRCGSDPGAGSVCPDGATAGNGLADYVSTGPDFDAHGVDDAGAAFLIDGITGSILNRYDHPEPKPDAAMGLIQNGLVQPAFGDLGQTEDQWDIYVPAVHESDGFTTAGRGYLFNGNFMARGRFIPFARVNDPTPAASANFGAAAAGIGEVDETTTQNEIMVGAIGPHAPGTNREVINDVHIFSTTSERALQTIPAPDQQGGSGFGTGVVPLGDLNGDGFLDFAISAGLYDLTTESGDCEASCAEAGRIYIFRSDDSEPAPEAPRGCEGKNLIAGTSANDELNGTAADDLIFGGIGDDALAGLAGDDCLDGGPGGDRVTGARGNDQLWGRGGDDRLIGSGGKDRMRAGPGDDEVIGGRANDRVHAGAGDDTVSGTGGHDVLKGGAGNDDLRGRGNRDRIRGDADNDRIHGGNKADRLTGNRGNDRLIGGKGRDRILGGGGNDRIRANDNNRDRITCGRGTDRVVADPQDMVADDCERVRRV